MFSCTDSMLVDLDMALLCSGIAELVFSAIQSADIDMRNELYKHIGKTADNLLLLHIQYHT
jgi:hypothetical protein